MELGLAIRRRLNFRRLCIAPELIKLVDREGEHRPGNQDKFNQPAQCKSPSEVLFGWLRDLFSGQDAVARGLREDDFRDLGGFFLVGKMAHAAKEDRF
jgi:hypothetical protein